jgi:hypothetical protein
VKKTLLHVCCANCLSDVARALGGGGKEIVLHFANPNIHPLVEFRRRRKSVRLLAEELGLDLLEEPYGLREFLAAVGERTRVEDGRCRACYAMRLGAAAAKAREIGTDDFTTTLLVSHHQERDALLEAGEEAARRHGVPFEAPDLRGLFGKDSARPRHLKLYRQGYCGCVFSEEERFRDTRRGE